MSLKVCRRLLTGERKGQDCFKKITFQFKIVEIAMVADVNKGMSILNRRHERWGDHNLMELSYVGQLRAFIASKYYHKV